VNEANAIQRSETAAFFKENGIAVMVGDWTRQDPHITRILKDYGRSGVPMYLFYPPGSGHSNGILLPQILTVDNLRAEIEMKGKLAGNGPNRVWTHRFVTKADRAL
jgi:thiol:disulfide interchange protein DsbD